MGKASSSKKVARVARTGGGRTRRGSSGSWVWPTLIGLVVVVGTGLIVMSKGEQTADASSPRRGDHWHAALGVDICGEFAPPITDQADPLGIHTHGDGVIHIHPSSETASGERATLGKYFDAVGAEVTGSEIKLPGQPAKKNGDKCGDKEAEVRVKTWSSRAPDAEERTVTGNPSDLRFSGDGELITIAFLPPDAEIRRPPSADQLDKLTDVPNTTPSTVATPTPDGVTPSTAPATSVPPSQPAATSPPTTAPPSP